MPPSKRQETHKSGWKSMLQPLLKFYNKQKFYLFLLSFYNKLFSNNNSCVVQTTLSTDWRRTGL